MLNRKLLISFLVAIIVSELIISSVEAGDNIKQQKNDKNNIEKQKKDKKSSSGVGTAIKNMVSSCVNCQTGPEVKKDTSSAYTEKGYRANFDYGNYGRS